MKKKSSIFLGFILLDDTGFDAKTVLSELENRWKIKDTSTTTVAGDSESPLVIDQHGYRLRMPL